MIEGLDEGGGGADEVGAGTEGVVGEAGEGRHGSVVSDAKLQREGDETAFIVCAAFAVRNINTRR